MTKTKCTVCNHEDVRQIHAQQEAGASHAKLSDIFDLSKPALQRHFANFHEIDQKTSAAPCGVEAHAPGVDLMTRFLHQDKVLEEANEAGYSEHEARAKIISLRQQGFDCCADDLLYWLLPEIKGEYSKTDPLWTRQKTDPQLSRAGL